MRLDTEQTAVLRQVDDLSHMLDMDLARLGIDTATVAGCELAVLLLAGAVNVNTFWTDLAMRVRELHGRTTDPTPTVRWAVVARFQGCRDALVNVELAACADDDDPACDCAICAPTSWGVPA